MAYEDITINQFMNCWFKKDFSVHSEEFFKQVYDEYVDTAGLYNSDQHHLVSYIYYLNNKINTVNLSVRLQSEFIEEFDIPYLPGLKKFRKFGYTVLWKNDKVKFLRDLDIIRRKQTAVNDELEVKIKELKKIKEKDGKVETTEKQSRQDFITMLNSLGKQGYQIFRNETTVEDLALMVKQNREEAEILNQSYGR